MNAGRELDALVAEHVMGWSLNSNNFGHVPRGWPPEMTPLDTNYDPVDVPAYSTDIAAAWEVVEKMNAEDIRLELYSPYGDPHWACQFWMEGELVAGAGVDTAPHAICLAALKAVGASAPAGSLNQVSV